MTITILQGDVVDQLRTLKDGSVHCVVTSPPYWGLRDYGTAKWEGGDPECNHNDGAALAERLRQKKSMIACGERMDGSTRTRVHDEELGKTIQYRNTCPKCGAIRIDNQIGLEKTPEEYVAKMVAVFREIKRVLRDDGTCWLNMGDCYNGSGGAGGDYSKGGLREGEPKYNGRNTAALKPKDLVGIPWRLAFALQKDGWYLRSDIIWSKSNPMPESVTDRPTKSHEYIFLLTKKARYFYDSDAIREPHKTFEQESKRSNFNDPVYYDEKAPDQVGKSRVGRARNEDFNPAGRNRRTVWEITTQPFPEAHFATFPEALVEPCIKAGTSERGCCPVCGSPWERVVEKETLFEGGSGKAGRTAEEVNSSGKWQGIQYGKNIKLGPTIKTETIGWQPTCKCDREDTVPYTVLDPFMGSGTTLKVARDLNRDGIGIELNPTYVKIARERLRLNEQLGVE